MNTQPAQSYTTTFALTTVLTLASVVPRLAPAFAPAGILPFARMFLGFAALRFLAGVAFYGRAGARILSRGGGVRASNKTGQGSAYQQCSH